MHIVLLDVIPETNARFKVGGACMNHRTNTYAVNVMFIILRILTAFLIISIFIPALNPARVSELINKNLSLFTSGFAYSTVLNGFKRALSRGWIEGSVLNLLFYSSTLSCLSIIVLGIGACSVSYTHL